MSLQECDAMEANDVPKNAIPKNTVDSEQTWVECFKVFLEQCNMNALPSSQTVTLEQIEYFNDSIRMFIGGARKQDE